MNEHLKNQLLQAANRFGTPLYVYHAGTIEQQYNKLKEAFAGLKCRIFYASKALTNISILRFINSLGAGIDCSSINELKMALHAGCAASNILYTSNGIAFEEISEAVDLGAHVNIDSLSNLKKFGEKYKNSYPVGIRLRPNILAGGNLKISTGHDKSKFGIPIEQINEVIQIAEMYDLQITCLHIHTGSEIKDVEVFIKGLQVLFELIPLFPKLKVIDLGGGFKVPYKPEEQGTPMLELGKALEKAVQEVVTVCGKELEVWFEPGKFMVSEAGYFLTEVNVIKETKNVTFVGVNSGFNHLIRPMFYDAYHSIMNLSNPNGHPHKYTVVGNICETDTFAWDRELPEIKEGNLLAFLNAGAYGFEMSSNFNSRYKPAEVLILQDQLHLIRKRDTWEDLIKQQIQVIE